MWEWLFRIERKIFCRVGLERMKSVCPFSFWFWKPKPIFLSQPLSFWCRNSPTEFWSYWERKVKSLSRVRLFATPWTVAHQAPPSMGFSRQEYWSGLPLPSPGDLPHPGIEPRSPTLQADALTSEPPGKPLGVTGSGYKFLEGERCLFSYSLILQKDILGILGICSLT